MKKITASKLSVKGQIALILLLIALLSAISPTVRYYVRSFLEYPIHYKEYKHFGIRIPSGYQIHGIDVSRWQQRIDWALVKKMRVGDTKVGFVFVKATEGTYIVDPQFERNWEQLATHKIARGAYHFFHPNLSPKDQALHFARTVRLKSGDLPPVVDIEEVNGMSEDQVRRYTKQFLEMLRIKYGVKPIMYTGRDFYRRHFAGRAEFEGYPLWIANYRVNELCLPDDKQWQFWQHSDEGNVHGINPVVDFNVFSGDSAAFRKLLIP
jgi:lysozyme